MTHLTKGAVLLGAALWQLPTISHANSTILWRQSASAQHHGYLMNDHVIANSQAIGKALDTQWKVAAYADFDHNGSADVLLRHQTSGQNYIYFNQGVSLSSAQQLNKIADQNWQVAGTGDFNGDGYADILWRNKSTGANYIYLMNGNTIAKASGLNTVDPTQWNVAVIGDLNGDGKDDLVWRNTSTGETYAYLLNGISIAQGGVISKVNSNWDLVASGDLDGDGKDDLIWRNNVTGENFAYLMNGLQISKAAVVNKVTDLTWKIQGVADFNGDGKADILWRHASTGLNYLYRMNGTTISSTVAVNSVPTGWTVAGVADYKAAIDNSLYVYFKKPDTWGAAINIYTWAGGSSDFGQWPGSPIESVGSNWYRQKLEAVNLSSEGCLSLIFNDSVSKTGDLSFCNTQGTGNYQISSGWSVGAPSDLAVLTGLSISPSSAEIAVGKTKVLSLMGTYDNKTSNGVVADSWSSSNNAIATVNGGTVTGLKEGSVTISAVKGSLKASSTVTIKAVSGATEMLYFKKPTGWTGTDVYAHIWTVNSAGTVVSNPTGDWPGLLLKEIEDSYYGVSVLPEYLSVDGSVHIIFNDGAKNQTDDLSVSGNASAYYQDGKWQTGNPVVPKVQVTFNGTSAPSGKYEAGHVLSISADQPLPGMSFVRWSVSGDRVNVLANSLSATTQLTVPSDIDSLNVTAVYGDEYSLGRDYYSQGQCAVCHGVDGQGQIPLLNLQARYTEASLTQKIAATMPTTNPKSCEGDCASEIAHMLLAEAFTFALDCSEGLIPPDRQIRLLTEREYRNTIRDLLGVTVGEIALPKKVGFEGASKGGSDTNAALKLADTDAEVYLNAAYQLAAKVSLSTVAAQFSSCSDVDCQINALAERAYRRLLSTTERSELKAIYNELGEKATLVAILSAPSFLYRSEQGQLVNASQLTGVLTESGYQYYQLSDFEIATLLSYSYWASMPDNDLFNKAKNNQLHTAAQIKAAIESMLSDSRAKTEYGEFVTGWLHVNNVSSKGHVKELGKDFLTETQLFAQDVAFNQSGHYGDLLTAPYTYLNKNLSENYGFGAVPSSSFQKVTISQPQRQGLIGQGSVLATFSMDTEQPNIITRGLFVRERLLCQTLGTPPANAGMLPNMDEVSSTRERFNLHGTVEGCASCHQYIDGVGFGTENFNGLGQFRLTENFRGQNIVALTGAGDIANIESVGTPSSGSGMKTEFSYVTGLSDLIAGSTNAKSCYVRQYYRHMRGAMEHDSTQNMQDSCTLQTISQDFAKGSLTLKQQMSKMADHAVFAIRKHRQ